MTSWSRPWKLGALPLVEGEGCEALSCMWDHLVSPNTDAEHVAKIMKIVISENRQEASRCTCKLSRVSLMTPGHHANDPWPILRTPFFMNCHVLRKSWPGVEGSRPRTETAYIPTERASKMMNIDVEFISFDELEPEISWIKGGPGPPAGGRVSGQSGVPCLPGGECFAP